MHTMTDFTKLFFISCSCSCGHRGIGIPSFHKHCCPSTALFLSFFPAAAGDAGAAATVELASLASTSTALAQLYSFLFFLKLRVMLAGAAATDELASLAPTSTAALVAKLFLSLSPAAAGDAC